MKSIAPQYLIDLIEDALQAARFESAKFGGIGPEADKIDRLVKEESRIFRESWLIPSLETALRAAYGEADAIRWAKERVSKGYNDRDKTFRTYMAKRKEGVE